MWTLPSLVTTTELTPRSDVGEASPGEVLHMCGTISHEDPWEVKPDLYFYRDSEEIEKEDQATAEKAVTEEEFQGECTPAPEFTTTHPKVTNWSEGMQVLLVSFQQFPTEDWST
uniref:40S ribosomal protein SA-like n=1 Tax=Halichoerus grypus TaxID=9711 RepID=UPI001658F9C0|nr:40S ribosomal protein SA-like [Halichoerus grypus]